MDETQFVGYFPGDEDGHGAGWYATAHPEGLEFFDDPDWQATDDSLIFGPFDTEDEAVAALDAYLERDMGIDVDHLSLCAKHAAEVLEADTENYPGNELAKRRFQLSVKAFAAAVGTGNPPAMVVGIAAGALFAHLCAAYPTAGSEVFRIIGNMWRRERGVPEIEYGREPKYERED